MIIQSNKAFNPNAMTRNRPLSCDDGGKLRFISFELTVQDKAKDPELFFVKLPLGNIRVVGGMSRISAKFKDPKAVMSVGWLKYKVPLQHWEETQRQGFNTEETTGLFSLGKALPLQTAGFSTSEGLEVCGWVKGTLHPGDTVSGYIIYVKD